MGKNISENSSRKRIVIIGGGFAGLNLAKKIDKKNMRLFL